MNENHLKSNKLMLVHYRYF